MEQDAIVKTRDLAVGYGRRPILEHIALEVKKGQILTLIGPNGAGKSTILKTLIQQLPPMGGTVYLDGRDMAALTRRDVAKRMSILMTEPVHPELMTCFDVAAAGRYPYTGRLGILTQADRDKVTQALELVQALDLADRDFSRISDGQRQRVLLARALCQEPQVLVLDEPTSYLDIRHKLELLAILKDLVRGRELAVIVSLHELDLALRISDYVVCVREGAIDRWGPPEEIFSPDYIEGLYGVSRGSFDASFGCPELEKVPGPPEVFVIGGGGSGIAAYRALQRRGVPFAAGVLHRGDLDHPVAKALAAEVVEEEPFQPITQDRFLRGMALVQQCERVLLCQQVFGPMNKKNRELAQYADTLGKLRKKL